LVLGEGERRPRRVQRGVRDEERQRLTQGAGQVLVRVDRDDPVDVEDRVGVDLEEAGVGVRAAEERDLVGVVAEVVEVASAARDETGILAALDRGTELAGGHRLSLSSLWAVSAAGGSASERFSSAARRTDLTMFWYPVHRQRLPETASRASPSVG